jgi:16S rRNA (uracil1498-N3)-methyltransferase
MPTFFIAPEAIAPPTIRISGPLLHHLRESLRLHRGESLTLTDHEGTRYRVEVTNITSQAIHTRILNQEAAQPRATPRIVLGQALLKGEKMDWVLQKATELGVDTIVPLETRHSVVKPNPGRIEHQVTRWRRIVLEAAQQSERWTIPTVSEPTTLGRFCDQQSGATIKGILSERTKGSFLTSLALPHEPRHVIAFLIGPEGGWTPQEQQLAQDRGFIALTLGERILRAETAALAALSILQSRVGGLG